MSALTEDRATEQMEGELLYFPVAVGAVIYGGALVALNTEGFAQPGASAPDLTAAGMATQRVVNTGDEGELYIEVRRGRAFKFENDPSDPVSQAHLLQPCYMVDDQTVTASDGDGALSVAGQVVDVEDDGVWVFIG
ncbi:MAG: hypothetical protein ABW146_08565 [Candidatus Sedimenticola sp. 6PFRAG7]